jgi:hypothetical protein
MELLKAMQEIMETERFFSLPGEYQANQVKRHSKGNKGLPGTPRKKKRKQPRTPLK